MQQNREEALTLELLEAIEAKCDVTQRHLADRLGVALGLANSYLKRCVRKGLVKITQAPANRYLYYLTPQGFIEKSRLTRQYLSASFDFYQRASDSVVRALRECEQVGARRVMFAGISELAEIASIRSHDFTLEIAGTYEPGATRADFVGKPVWGSLADVPHVDAAVLTALRDCAEIHQALRDSLPALSVVVPGIVQPMIGSLALPP